jgi:hypothetical protein
MLWLSRTVDFQIYLLSRQIHKHSQAFINATALSNLTKTEMRGLAKSILTMGFILSFNLPH